MVKRCYLKILEEIKSPYGKSVRTKCACGKEKVFAWSRWTSQTPRACSAECKYNGRTTHGASRHPLFWTWSGMMARCYRKTSPEYRNYGGRGIHVCERWHNPRAFYDDMSQKPSPHHSLDRVDNMKGYSPNNCRWATAKEQMSNVRYNRWIEYNGVKKTVAQWAVFLKMRPKMLEHRIARGWEISRAFGPRERSIPLKIGKTTKTREEWAQWAGITRAALYSRLSRGCPPHIAVAHEDIYWRWVVKNRPKLAADSKVVLGKSPLTLRGVTKSVSWWARKAKIHGTTISRRHRDGCPGQVSIGTVKAYRLWKQTGKIPEWPSWLEQELKGD